MHDHSINNDHMKAHFNGHHYVSVPEHIHTYSDYSNPIYMADIAITYRHGGQLNIVKNRFEPPNHQNVSVQEATKLFSRMLSGMSFRDNDLKMFKEGLRQQIESAIEIAIKTFHESR